MYIFYNKETDYLEVFKKRCKNYGSISKNDVIVFYSEKSSEEIGYGVENISNNITKLNFISAYEKFSILVKIARIQHGYTQQEAAKKIGIQLVPYQRIESGTNNPTLKTILKIKNIFPEIELSEVA